MKKSGSKMNDLNVIDQTILPLRGTQNETGQAAVFIMNGSNRQICLKYYQWRKKCPRT